MIYLIVLLALIVRLVAIDQSLWLDEAISALAVNSHSLPSLVGEYLIGDFSPPLYFILQWGWVRIFGISEAALRLPSVIYGVLTVYFVYLITKLVSKKKSTSIIAGTFAAFSPLLIFYSQEARMYSLATLGVTASVYYYLKHKEVRERKYYWYYLVFFSIALYSHYLTWLMIPVFLMGGIIYVLPIITLLPWAPTLLKQLSTGTGAASELPLWAGLSSLTFKNISLVFVKFVTGRISTFGKGLPLAVVLLGSSVFAWIIAFIGIKKTKRIIIYWLVVPLFLGALVSLKVPVFTYFRFLFVVPAFIVLVSIGIERLVKARKFVATFLIVASLVFSLIYLLNSGNHREDWKSAVDFVHSQNQEAPVFIRNSVKSPFDYYDKGRSVVISNPEDLLGYESLWYFPYAQAIFDPKKEVEMRLSEMGFELTKEYTFREMSVYKYANRN